MQPHRVPELQPVWTVLSAILASYGVHLALWLFLPATSAFDYTVPAIAIWLAYILLVAVVVVLTYPLFAHLYPPSDPHDEQYFRHLRLALAIAVFLSVAGVVVVMLYYVFVLQVDYSQGFAEARSQLPDREGISPLPVIGNFFGRFYMLALGILVVCWEQIRPFMRFVYLAACAVAAGAFSLAIGGRVSILVAIGVLASSIFMRKMKGQRLLPGFKFASALVLLLTLAYLYSANVFSDRAEQKSLDAETYVSALVEFLGGEVNNSFHSIQTVENDTYRDFLYFATANLAYVLHVIWAFEEILSSPERPSTLIWSQAQLYMFRVGFIADPPEPHLVAGRWVPLVAAIWYDFGGLGLIPAAILHGMTLSIAVLIFTRGRLGVLGFGFASAILVLTVLSPMAAVSSMTLDFTYLCISVLFLFALIGSIRMGRILTATSNRQGDSSS